MVALRTAVDDSQRFALDQIDGRAALKTIVLELVIFTALLHVATWIWRQGLLAGLHALREVLPGWLRLADLKLPPSQIDIPADLRHMRILVYIVIGFTSTLAFAEGLARAALALIRWTDSSGT